jgi:protein-tyrosine phosphatase
MGRRRETFMRQALQRQTRVLTSKHTELSEAGLHQRRPRNLGIDITWITARLALGGGIWTAENMAEVARAGITDIIDMQIEFDDTPLAEALGINVLWNATDDDFQPKPPELFQRGVDFVQRALEEENGRVFIHCAAGVHRAAMMTLAVLCSQGWELEDAMRMISLRRPVVDFAEVYVESVEKFLEEQVRAGN